MMNKSLSLKLAIKTASVPARATDGTVRLETPWAKCMEPPTRTTIERAPVTMWRTSMHYFLKAPAPMATNNGASQSEIAGTETLIVFNEDSAKDVEWSAENSAIISVNTLSEHFIFNPFSLRSELVQIRITLCLFKCLAEVGIPSQFTPNLRQSLRLTNKAFLRQTENFFDKLRQSFYCLRIAVNPCERLCLTTHTWNGRRTCELVGSICFTLVLFPDFEEAFVFKLRTNILTRLENGLRMRVLLMGLIALSASMIMLQSESSAARLRLSWSDNSENEEGFEIQRMTPDTGFVAIAIVGINVNRFTDLNVAPGSTYCYRVRAFDAESISEFSNLGCATTPTTVSVSRFGSGAGSVLSNPAGIDCGNDCAEPYPRGTLVTLLPNPVEGSVFAGWSGAVCAGNGVCMFNVETDLSVTAVFDSINPESVPPPSDPPPPPPTTPSPPALILTGLSANLVSPQFVGAPIIFSAAATGGVSPLQFKWWVYDGFVWRVEKNWDTSNTFVFNPTTHATYAIGLWARSSGNSSDSPENDAVLTQAFTIMPLSCPAGQFLAEFYNNSNLSGRPTFTTCDGAIGYYWYSGASGYGIGSDHFSVRWTGRIFFDAGLYNFVATADDGIRARVDGNLIIDGWIDQEATTYQAILDISAGEHSVQVDYYQNGGDALTQLYWWKAVIGNDDYYVMFEREHLTVAAPGVLGNDNNFGGNPLSATLVSGTANGALVLNSDGSFSYTPNANFNGTDSFTYRADYGVIIGNLATVTITVTAVNDVPMASNDAYVVLEDNSLVVDAPGVLGNDNDLDGNALTAVLLSTTTNGTLNFNSDGSFSYTPNPNFTGTDTFTYVANDGASDGNVAMVAITVTALNDIPMAQNDGYETIGGSVLTVVAPGVLANDTDADSNPITAILVTEPLFGTLTLNPDGSFEYIPVANFAGTDSFSYKVNDGSADSNVAMVAIAVYPPAISSVAPGTSATTVSVSRFGSGVGSVLSNPPGIECGNDCIEPYARGTIVTLIPSPAEGSVFAGWNGAGCAGMGVCMFNLETDLSVTAVFDTINPESAPPRPTDPPPPPSPPLLLTALNANLVSPQVVGTAVTFTAAAAGGNSPLQFKWWTHDGTDWRMQQDWNTGNTFVFAPTQATPYLIAVWARSAGSNSDAPENDAVLTQAFTITPLTCPNGRYLAQFYNNMTLNGDPALMACHTAVDFNWATGEPGSGVNSDNFSARWIGRFPFSAGVYSFTATANDGIRAWIDGNLIIDGWIDQGATTYQATLDISEGEHVVQIEYYENSGDALAQVIWQRVVTSADDYYVMFEHESLAVDAPGALGNDNNLSGNSLSATLVSGTSNGVLVLNPDGSFSYTPSHHFSGTDSFTYRADNGSATSNLATGTIAVTAVNDVPVASNDSYVVMEDNGLVVDAPGVLGNDNDLDGNSLVAVLVSTTTNGALNFYSDGSFSYTPNPNFTGTDTFTYLANDGAVDGNVAMVTITVMELNDIPIAINDSYETNGSSALSVFAPGVLGNDVDPEGNPMAAILVTEPLFGSLILNPDGSFEYIPVANFAGTDSFSYKVTDGSADSNVATVNIAVNPGSGT